MPILTACHRAAPPPWSRRARAWASAAVALASLAGCTQEDVVFCREASCAERVVQEIDNASRSVHTAIYALTSDEIIDALASAASRPGVEVQVVAERSQTDASVMAQLGAAGINARYAFKRDCSCGGVPSGIMHHKFTVVDGRTVLTGSYNYSCSAEFCSEEHVVMLVNPRLAESFEAEFTHLFETGEQP